MATANKMKRVTFMMPQRILDRLEELQNKADAGSLSEVLRRAAAVYDFLWTEKENGSTILVETKDGRVKEIPLF